MNWDSSICRVCLKSESQNLDFCVKIESINEYSYLDLFNTCTRLNARLDDDLPKSICNRCSDDLCTSFEFLNRAISSDEILRNNLKDENPIEYSPDYDNDNIDVDHTNDNKWCSSTKILVSDSLDIKTVSPFEENIESLNQFDEDEHYIDMVTKDTFEVVNCEEQFYKDDLVIVECERAIVTNTDEVYDSDAAVEYVSNEDPVYQAREKLNTESSCGSKTVECKICFKVLKRWSLKHHLSRYHKQEKQLLCSACPKTFNVASDLTTHMQTHDIHRERKFICTVCRKGFFKKQALHVHIERHMGVKKYQCDICPKNFTTKKCLEVHVFTHNRESGRFICKYCSKRFTSNADLIVHERFHTGDYPYKCNLCDKSYAVKSHFNYHMGKHKGVTYKCDQCDKEFMNRGSLTAHKYKHLDRMPHECLLCKKGFPSPYKLTRHQISCHKIIENPNQKSEVQCDDSS